MLVQTEIAYKKTFYKAYFKEDACNHVTYNQKFLNTIFQKVVHLSPLKPLQV